MLNLLARNVEVSRQLVYDGTVVNKSACDTGGQNDYSFHLNRVTLDQRMSPSHPEQSPLYRPLFEFFGPLPAESQ